MYKIIACLLLSVLPNLAHAQAKVIYDKDGERIVFNTARFFYIVTYNSEQEDGSFELRSGEIWPGNNISPSVSANVTVDKNTGDFIYAYALMNKPEGPYGITNLLFLTQVILEADDFSVFNGWLPMHKPATSKVLWSYIKEPEYEGLQPGNTQDGYVITHAGLPILIEYRAKALVSWSFPDQGLHGEVGDLAYKILEDTEYASGQTVGPGTLPDPFVPTDFLDIIITYNKEASLLGWIASDTLASSFDAQLQATKANLESSDNAAAAVVLSVLLAEVEDNFTNGYDISNEAYALLKYNIGYLLRQISK